MSLSMHLVVALFVLLGVCVAFAIHIMLDAGNPMRVPIAGVLRRNWLLCSVTIFVKWLIATTLILVAFVGFGIAKRFGPDHLVTSMSVFGVFVGCFPDLAILAALAIWRRRLRKLRATTRFDKAITSFSEKLVSRLTVEINREARRRMSVIYETYEPEVINKAWEMVLPAILAASNRPHLRRIRHYAQKVNSAALELGFLGIERELERAQGAHIEYVFGKPHPHPYGFLNRWDGEERRARENKKIRRGPRRCDSYVQLPA